MNCKLGERSFIQHTLLHQVLLLRSLAWSLIRKSAPTSVPCAQLLILQKDPTATESMFLRQKWFGRGQQRDGCTPLWCSLVLSDLLFLSVSMHLRNDCFPNFFSVMITSLQSITENQVGRFFKWLVIVYPPSRAKRIQTCQLVPSLLPLFLPGCVFIAQGMVPPARVRS